MERWMLQTTTARSALLASELPPGHPDEFVGRPITPAEQIRVLLARKKAQGIIWEKVWPWAVKRVRWPHDHDERMTWKATIVWAEPAFRAAYEGGTLVDMSALVIAEREAAAA